jgi:hypothetical protein
MYIIYICIIYIYVIYIYTHPYIICILQSFQGIPTNFSLALQKSRNARSLSIRGHDLRHGELFDRTLHSLGGHGLWVAPGSTGQHGHPGEKIAGKRVRKLGRSFENV